MRAFRDEMQFLWSNPSQQTAKEKSEQELHASAYSYDKHKCSPVSQLFHEELPTVLPPSPIIADWPESASGVFSLAQANSAKQVGRTLFNWQNFLSRQTTLQGVKDMGSDIDSWQAFVFGGGRITPQNAALSLLALATAKQTPQTGAILHYIVSTCCSCY